MLRASSRAAGSRLVSNASVKMKCVNVVPSTATQLNWAGLWSAYAGQNMGSRLDAIVSYGANAVKITCEGIGSNYPSDTTLFGNIADFCAKLRARNLRLYLNLNSAANLFAGSDGSQVVANVALNMKVLRWLVALAPDLLVAVDVCNEINFNQPPTWSNSTQMAADLAYLIGQVRKVAPGLPVSFSVYMNSATGFAGNALLKLQHDLSCDFHDYHPYNSLNGSTSLTPATVGIPVGGDPAQLEAQSWFLGRHLIGENGLETGNSTAAQAAWVYGLGDQARRPASHGAVLFCDVNYYSSTEVGGYGIAGYPAITTAFSQWPGGI